MFQKKILIILFLTVDLTLSLKSSDFCILKQQKECKGFYNKEQNYQISRSLFGSDRNERVNHKSQKHNYR